MGPLHGVRIVEFAGIGPGPFACMMLADMGADVLRIDRAADDNGSPDRTDDRSKETLLRGRKSVTLNLKKPADLDVALKLTGRADALVEGFRPGVMERLGLGPDVCMKRNPALVYGRMTGWGQNGPLAGAAGHDINYIALSGALWSVGETDCDPVPPLNLLGDYGGGAMFLAFGIVCALLRARQTGQGDVVDAAICDGTAALMAPVYSALSRDLWVNQRGANRLDGGAPYYGVYKCADDRWISIAPLEAKFWALFLKLLKIDPETMPERLDPENWKELKRRFKTIFAERPRAYWCALFEGTDICFAPVLDLQEAKDHPHNRARGILREKDGHIQPMPAPRYKQASPELPSPPPAPGAHNKTALSDWGIADTGDRGPDNTAKSDAVCTGAAGQDNNSSLPR
ncbi:CaiB/BaiF CoA-transferase family protein [Roseibium sp. RKSG952]|uniref:CaiB/BaiF CoA transferase family protein n=1 Tax=Roseibium sp. RKSG952 TaxID=2529384 RepID=UPI0012BD2F71|nr:CaiB/BaiF CoA-transferase family protein [Roseibium sp. RKSG952]MTH96194.1 CoA transferase [Roseibium sp. RKSG952]